MNDYTILVNHEYLLPRDYVPKNLVVTDENENNFHHYKDPSLKPMIRADVLPYFLKMQKVALEAGVHLLIDSGYRSYGYQEQVLKKNILEKGDEAYFTVALPGASEHQTGLAIDIAYYRDGVYTDAVCDGDKEVEWLKENSYKFGFVLRYPKGKESITHISYEPWHYRFVGLELARKLWEQDFTLEEYYEKNGK